MTRGLSRRSFVKAAPATALVMTSIPGLGHGRQAPVSLLDPRLSASLPTDWMHGGLVLDNVMRQWRDGLGETVASNGAIALVRWDMALMLRQLAREARLSMTVAVFAPAIFNVHIAPQGEQA